MVIIVWRRFVNSYSRNPSWAIAVSATSCVHCSTSMNWVFFHTTGSLRHLTSLAKLSYWVCWRSMLPLPYWKKSGPANPRQSWSSSHQILVIQKNGIAFDIDIFNEIILRDIVGIQSIRSSDRITYLEGIKSYKPIIKAVQENSDSIGFLFFPVKKRDFIKVADEHMVLPPKSTWFEPRIKNGIIVQDVDLQVQAESAKSLWHHWFILKFMDSWEN
jgi:hypothetical protein